MLVMMLVHADDAGALMHADAGAMMHVGASMHAGVLMHGDAGVMIHLVHRCMLVC